MRKFLLLASLMTALVLASCAYGGEDIETVDIVATIPWGDFEEADYVLLDRSDEDEIGTGTLIVDTNDDGQFEFQINFAGESGTDQASVLVDANTLKPLFVQRERHLDDEDSLTEGEYTVDDDGEPILNIKTVEGDNERTVPMRLDEDHYYDNESSLFLWRTIPFAQDYKVSYHSVLAVAGSIQTVTLLVRRQEEITVPAGTFDTWRVEITTADRRQEAWFSTDPSHVVVQYDNSFQLFKLTGYRGAGPSPSGPVPTPDVTPTP